MKPKARKESFCKYVSGGWRHRCGDPEKSRKVGMGEKTRVGLQYLICFNLCLWQKKKFSVLFLIPSANVQVLISSFMISGTGARSVIRGLQARWSWSTTWAALSITIWKHLGERSSERSFHQHFIFHFILSEEFDIFLFLMFLSRLSNSGATSPAGSNQSNPSPTPSL